MTPSAKGNSIWLMFDKHSEALLQKLIEDLSKQFNTPSFKPHLTLLPAIEFDENLVDRFSKFTQEIFPIELEVLGINTSNEFYKSIFLEIKKTNQLENIYQRSLEIFKDGKTNSKFEPHISLFYSYHSIEVINKIINDLQTYQFNKILVNKISLVSTEGTPEFWKEIISINL
ncbi:MAG: hypothetical protein N3F03_02995 [Ignavibacteria bacterium]|nr:hypothetical protein [Ignavibacteria bacterium]